MGGSPDECKAIHQKQAIITHRTLLQFLKEILHAMGEDLHCTINVVKTYEKLRRMKLNV